MKEYLVLNEQLKLLHGPINKNKFAAKLNEYAQQGWRVITITPHDVKIGFGHQQEIVVILERDAS